MDISMWKGYDPDDHSKNAAYFEPWYTRMVPSRATVEDSLNKYKVCLGDRHLDPPCYIHRACWGRPFIDAMQEYCELVHHKEAVSVTSCEDLKAFYVWFVLRVGNNDSSEAVIGRSWRHIASMVYFHGYITPEQWGEGGFPDPNSHYTFKQDTMRTAKANGEYVFLRSVASALLMLYIQTMLPVGL